MPAAHVVHMVAFSLDDVMIGGAFPTEIVETLCACSHSEHAPSQEQQLRRLTVHVITTTNLLDRRPALRTRLCPLAERVLEFFLRTPRFSFPGIVVPIVVFGARLAVMPWHTMHKT